VADYRLISIVVPVYEEADSLDSLMDEIREVGERHDLHLQVVFVDDGSKDGSWAKIVELTKDNPAIGGLRFKTNCGKAAALMAGLAAAEGDLVFTMDADLQDPPEEIPRFIEKIDSGYDVVSGWKKVRYDPWHKVYPSRVFNKMIGFLTGVHLHDHVCGFKCFRREAAKDLTIYGEFHRFMCVLPAARGYRVTEIATRHRPRTQGVGKYGFSRFAKGFVDLLSVCFLTRFGRRPQHVIGVAGLYTMIFALVLGSLLSWMWIPWLAITGLVLAAGLNLVALGLISTLIISRRPVSGMYQIVDRVGWCASAEIDEPFSESRSRRFPQ